MQALGALELLIAGCGPILLKVDVAGTGPAQLQTKLVVGDTPASPAECSTPCEVAIARDCTYDLVLQAPGYYPATVSVGYFDVQMLTQGAQGAESLLRVPLIPRTDGSRPFP